MTTVPTAVDAPAATPPAPGGSPTPAPEPARTGLELHRYGPRSLVGRLVSGVVVLVIVLVLAIGAATFLLLRSSLYDQLRNQVGTVGSNNASRYNCLATGQQTITCNFYIQSQGGSNSTTLEAPLDEWLTVYSAQTGVLDISEEPGGPMNMQISDDTAADLTAQAGRPAYLTTADGERLMAVSVPINKIPGAYLITGLSTHTVDRTLGRLLTVETSIGAAAIAVALLASYFGVTFGLRPLRRVTSTAQEVTAELSSTGAGLERRVPVAPSTDTEVGQLATSVNTLLGAVETQFAARVRSEDRMREFLADASHELRTPLTSIRGFAELSRMQRRQAAAQAGLDPATAAEDDALDRIESEGTRMSKLVDDLLLLARSDHGSTPARDRVEVAAMVSDVVESARVAYPDRPIDAAVPDGLAVLGDRDQLLRVVRNLVTNAAVHTAPGGPILVSAHPDGEEVVIEVADSGPGLEPEQAAHVFDRFWRADKARTRARGGSGLGMSIVATIIEQHQGAVRFDSTPETGSTVTVVLPAALAR